MPALTAADLADDSKVTVMLHGNSGLISFDPVVKLSIYPEVETLLVGVLSAIYDTTNIPQYSKAKNLAGQTAASGARVLFDKTEAIVAIARDAVSALGFSISDVSYSVEELDPSEIFFTRIAGS